MVYPIDNITTNSLDQNYRDPSQARAELYTLALTVKKMIAATGTGPYDSLKLDNNGNIPATVKLVGQTSSNSFSPPTTSGRGVNYSVSLGLTTLKIGIAIRIRMNVSNSGASTMNVDGLGAYPIRNLSPASNTWSYQMLANQIVTLVFNGAYWYLIDPSPVIRSALVYNRVNQTIPTNRYSVLKFSTESSDSFGMHRAGQNNTRLTVPAGANLVKLSALVTWAGNTTGSRYITLRKNGGLFAGVGASRTQALTDGQPVIQMIESAIIPARQNDFFEMEVSQSSGQSLDVLGGQSATWFFMEVIK